MSYNTLLRKVCTILLIHDSILNQIINVVSFKLDQSSKIFNDLFDKNVVIELKTNMPFYNPSYLFQQNNHLRLNEKDSIKIEDIVNNRIILKE